MAKTPPANTLASEPEIAEGVLVKNAVRELPALRQMLQVMSLEAGVKDEGNDDFVMSMMEQILTAESIDDIFAAQEGGMVSGKDFHSRPFFLAEDTIEVKQLTKENGMPFYVVFKAVEIATGDEYTVNCGGKTFLAVVHALRMKGYFERTEEFPQGRPVVIIATPSPEGAYLSLKPYKLAATNGSAKK